MCNFGACGIVVEPSRVMALLTAAIPLVYVYKVVVEPCLYEHLLEQLDKVSLIRGAGIPEDYKIL